MRSMRPKDPNNTFGEAYSRLNDAQKEAVDTIEGPVMVIAGPGTGKTQILTLRIANILQKTDAAPESVLALTFTESGREAMRERLRTYIGEQSYRVPIFTFHGFAEHLIRSYPDAYERIVGGKAASDLDSIRLIETALEGGSVRILRPMGDPTYYVSPIRSVIASMKREYYNPNDLMVHIGNEERLLAETPRLHEKGVHKGKVRSEYTKREKNIAKLRELHFVYVQYEALLREEKLYDYEDMIIETVKVLERDESVLRDLQETYQYIHADEHQDVNGAQNTMLELLASFHEHPNIFVVGDEKQAIYRFQGASLENFLFFEDRFGDTSTIALTENYRSGQPILDAAHSLIAVSDGPLASLRVPLTAQQGSTGSVAWREFSHQVVEDEWVVHVIEEEIANGTHADEIAIIVRTNREVEEYAYQARKAGIPVVASAEGNILTHPILAEVRALMEVVLESERESALFRVLHGAYWKIFPGDLVRIMSARSQREPLAEVVRDRELLALRGIRNPEAFLNVGRVIDEARCRESIEAPHRVLEYLLRESGFLEFLLERDPIEGTRVVRRLYDEVERMAGRDGIMTLRGVQDLFRKREAYRLPLDAPYINTSTHAVHIMTAHKSKGLEFEVVIVPHLVDSLWGGARKRTYFDVPLTRHLKDVPDAAFDDEERLLYVAMTRAKRKLMLSASRENIEGKVMTCSRLISALSPDTYDTISTEAAEEAFSPSAALIKDASSQWFDRELFTTLLCERGISATALNNYLRSPWEYLYRNILRIPEVEPVAMQYGTAIHTVLEAVARTYAESGAFLSMSDVSAIFNRALDRFPLTVEEHTRLHERGLAALAVYIPHMGTHLSRQTKQEFSLRVMLPTGLTDIPEILLTGKLDRLDFNDRGEVILVVDYKTGKPKTRGEIEGTTKNSDGGYKRQLVFYALLLELYDDPRYRSREGLLSFVEPDSKGSLREERFCVTDEEIIALKEEIIAMVSSITNGTFVNVPCDPSQCSYCSLVERLQLP